MGGFALSFSTSTLWSFETKIEIKSHETSPSWSWCLGIISAALIV